MITPKGYANRRGRYRAQSGRGGSSGRRRSGHPGESPPSAAFRGPAAVPGLRKTPNRQGTARWHGAVAGCAEHEPLPPARWRIDARSAGRTARRSHRLGRSKRAGDARALLPAASAAAAQTAQKMPVPSSLLHPPLLDELGLAAALASYVEGCRQHAGIEIEVDVSPNFGRLDQDVEMGLFRIVQEGLANIGRRAGSVSAVIRLERGPCEVRLELKAITRDLSAHPAEPGRTSIPLGVGILGMRARAEQLGGRLEIAP